MILSTALGCVETVRGQGEQWEVACGPRRRHRVTAPGPLVGINFSPDFLIHQMFIMGRYCTEKTLGVHVMPLQPALTL